MANPEREAGAISVSSLGHSLTANVTASKSILSVASELEAAANSTTDEEERARLMRWADQLADAVITVTSSASSTAIEIGSLSTTAYGKREK